MMQNSTIQSFEVDNKGQDDYEKERRMFIILDKFTGVKLWMHIWPQRT